MARILLQTFEATVSYLSMYSAPAGCPNPTCSFHTAPPSGWYAKKGYYRSKFDRQPVPRYRCKGCGRYFGSHTHTSTYRQHRPDVNAPLMGLLCSGMTMRRAAGLLHLSRRTVAKKLAFLGARARAAHAIFLTLPEAKTAYVQFDELETCEHSKLKPLSVSLAVRAKTGQIIGAEVASMNCHGHTAKASVSLYGRRQDTRKAASLSVLRNVALVAKPTLTVATDKKATYRPLIKDTLPTARHQVHPSRKTQPGQRDPMFKLNHLCAKLRSDLSRLSRRTWSLSKKPECLQAHLDLYIAFNNRYSLF